MIKSSSTPQTNKSRAVGKQKASEIPDARATVKLFADIISKSVLPKIEDGSKLNLVVASKTLRLMDIEPLAGRPLSTNSLAPPKIRTKGKVRDRWHKDRFFGFFYVAQGEGDLLFCQKVVACEAGHLGFVLPKCQRSYGAASHWERPDIEKANCDLFWFFVDSHGGTLHICWSRGVEHDVSPFVFVSDDGLMPLVELLAVEVAADKPAAAVRFLLWLIFDRLHRNLLLGKGYPHHDEEQPHRNMQQLPTHRVSERAKHYVEANLAERLTLEKVARAIYTSRTTLAQAFHEDTGETFNVYLTRRRMELAQHLLKTTTLRIAEIAFHSGFTNSQYFSDTFRRRFGMTPSEYRKTGR
jgi:AraC-like DNA-binding protein